VTAVTSLGLKIASWNVNSLRVRLPHLVRWLETAQPDLLGLQETKTTDDKFPTEALHAAGYRVVFAGQPTYNGVAILIRDSQFEEAIDWSAQDPRLPDDQKRLIAVTVTPKGSARPLRFVNVYVPNGSEVGSEKYDYKRRWLEALQTRINEELSRQPDLALVGDFNIAPDDRDVHDPQAWHEKILCSTPERRAFSDLLNAGLTDSFRQHCPDAGHFSWWDYRQAGFRRGLGLRIDHVLLSASLAAGCSASVIDKDPRTWEQPSDHAPVVASV
jgi:exodeoxyribonuclease III